MTEFKPIVLDSGVFSELGGGDTLSADADHHSGMSSIYSAKTITVAIDRQMINFTHLDLDGTINLEGDLWLA